MKQIKRIEIGGKPCTLWKHTDIDYDANGYNRTAYRVTEDHYDGTPLKPVSCTAHSQAQAIRAFSAK